MTIQTTDNFITQRGSDLYKIESQNLMSTMQDADLLLVSREQTNYKVSWSEVKDDLGGGGGNSIYPNTNDITITPSVIGTGTELDPYVLSESVAAPLGGAALTAETITIDSQAPNTAVKWTVTSDADDRFDQPEGITDANGDWSGKLQYLDEPLSSGDTVYEGTFQIGLVYFSWRVSQKEVAEAPTVVNNVSLIDSTPGEGNRFTSQSFVASSQVENGIPVSTKTFDAYVEGSINQIVTTSNVTNVDTTTNDGSWAAQGAPPDGGGTSTPNETLYTDSGNGQWAIINSQNTAGAPTLSTTTNFTSFTTVSSPGTISWAAIAGRGNDMVAVGGSPGNGADNVMYSGNGGSSWSTVTPGASSGISWSGVAMANTYITVAVGGYDSKNTGQARILISNNAGQSWTSGTSSGFGTTERWSGVGYGPVYGSSQISNGFLVCSGSSTTIKRSAGTDYNQLNNSSYWTTSSTGLTASYRQAVYARLDNKDCWFLFGYNNNAVSYDAGQTWEEFTPKLVSPDGTSYTMINSIGVGPGQICAALSGAPWVIWSTDGVNWNWAPTPLINGSANTNWQCVAYTTGRDVNAGSWAAIGDSGNPSYIKGSMTSIDGRGYTQTDVITCADQTNFENLPSGTYINQSYYANGTVANDPSTDGFIQVNDTAGSWNEGSPITGPEQVIDNARLYCKFNTDGTIEDLQSTPQDPPYTTVDSNPGLTLTFPATFPSGLTPDEELNNGTTLTVEVTAENSSSTSGPVSATVQPTPEVPDAPLAGLTTLYTAYGSPQTITNGINLADDGGLVWIKCKNKSLNNVLTDTVRGASESLDSATSAPEFETSSYLTGFNDNGFAIGTGSDVGAQGEDFVAWTFGKAEKYFDVVEYTGNGSTQTIPHSLGTKPGMILVKMISGTDNWAVYHSSEGTNKYGTLNSNNLFGSSSNTWNDTEPTDTDFTVGPDFSTNNNNETNIAYLFAEDTPGVIKCGSYVGNGSDSGPTVITGFEPQWLLIKKSAPNSGNDFASSWVILDNKRNPTNPRNSALFPDQNSKQSTTTSNNVTFNSDGFTIGASNSTINGTDNTLIYVAIAATPAAVSMTPAQLAEAKLKFSTFENRSMVKCGNDAEAARDALIQELALDGYSLTEILNYL